MTEKNKSIEWGKILEVELMLLLLPALVLYLIALKWTPVLKISYYFLISLFVFQAALALRYSFSALMRRRFNKFHLRGHIPRIPKTTFIICAYLPNEIDVVEDTVLNVLENVERPIGGLEVILSYNTPHPEQVESRLRALMGRWPEFISVRVEDSRGKSDNLNHAIGMASGKMICLLDADHRIMPDCLEKAWRWLDAGYDVVQGRSQIRNGNETFLTALVQVEFEVMYGVSHTSRSLLYDTALFGGSNAFWKASVIKKLKFTMESLTEDIDLTLRALLSGYHIVHDRSIISTELAPETVGTLWHQRKRWSQGWFECSVRYQWRVLNTKYLGLAQRFLWTTLLLWRVFYDMMSHMLLAVLFAFWLYNGKIVFPMTPYIWFSIGFSILSSWFETVVAYKNAAKPRGSVDRYIYYVLMAYPYTFFKSLIHMAAIRDELVGNKQWVSTRRIAHA